MKTNHSFTGSRVIKALPGAVCSKAPFGGGYRVTKDGIQVSQTCRTAAGAWRSAHARLSEAKSLRVSLPTRQELIGEAGMLNNHPLLVNVDHVTFMGLMDRDECEQHVAKLRAYIQKLQSPTQRIATA